MRRPLLLFALCCHLAFAAAYALLTPAFEGPDESDHYAYAFHLANAGTLPLARGFAAAHGRLPLDETGLGHHPPLYYAVLALGMRLCGGADTVHSLLANDKPGAVLRFRHGGDEQTPVASGIALLHGLRAVSVLLGLLSVLLVHRLGSLCCEARPEVADAAALLVACLPMWSFLHGVLNSDALAILLSQAVLVLLVGWLGEGRLGRRRAVLLGAGLGAALLTKLTAMFLVPLSLGVLAWVCRRGDRRASLPAAAASAGLAAGLAGWWFVRASALYGDPLARSAHDAAFAAAAVPEGQALEWLFRGCLPQLAESLLGTLGWFALPPPDALVYGGAVVAVVALAGLLRALRRGAGPRHFALLGAAVLLVLGLTLQFNLAFRQPQARLLFPAIGPMAVLCAAGLCAWAPHRQKWLAVFALVPPAVGFAVLARHFLPAFDPRMAPAPAHHASLVGDIVADPTRPGIELDASQAPLLRWRDPQGGRGSEYSVYLFDADGRIFLATREWTHTAITGRSFRIPQVWWEQLPEGSYRCRVRRVPDWGAGERLHDVPASAAVEVGR